MTDLDSSNVGVLRDVLVLVESILGQFALLLLDGKLDQKEHHRLERRDRDVSGALAGNMLVKQGQSRRGLVDPDELVSPLQDIFGFLVRWRRLLQRGAKLASPVTDKEGQYGHGEREYSKRRGRGDLRRTMLGNLLCGLNLAGRGEVGSLSSLRKPKGVDKVALAWHSLIVKPGTQEEFFNFVCGRYPSAEGLRRAESHVVTLCHLWCRCVTERCSNEKSPAKGYKS